MAPSAEFLPRISSPEPIAGRKLRGSKVDDFVTHLYCGLVPG